MSLAPDDVVTSLGMLLRYFGVAGEALVDWWDPQFTDVGPGENPGVG
jgi:hypothetical protein